MSEKSKIQKVEKYYDEHTHKYIESGYGDVIQAHRPSDLNELLSYISKNAGIKDGMRILDAGCGICGPSIFFAKHFNVKITAITNSIEQVKMARQKITEQSLSDKIEVFHYDYHKIETLFEKESFDLVIMLESFGHAINKKQLLKGVAKILRKEGHVYIKDYFQKEITGSSERKKGMKKGIRNMNKYYVYNLPDLNETIKILRRYNLNLQFVKRNELPIDDQHYVTTFEKNNNIDIFENEHHYLFLEPLELYFKKPADIDVRIV